MTNEVSESYLAALFQFLMHLLGGHVHIDNEVWRQELTDADVFDLIVVLHTCEWKAALNTRLCTFENVMSMTNWYLHSFLM